MPKLNLITLKNGNQVISGKCVVTGENYTTPEFPAGTYEKYRQGAMLQDAFHMLKPEEREFILTGFSPKGWEQTFGKEEEEECEV